ncbi:hypothetical protein CL629_02875 [bacterium]|nr:hypothetical protein [bacterium]|tara:strand:+ start:1738 stop:2832 length:1095 start_codon:yes stop_codon:yes gene_type:complete
MFFEIGLFVLGIIILVKGADFIVDSAARLAKLFGISDFIVGLTIVAIGTSLPELAASVLAASYGDTSLAVGNVLGSNMANLGLILGVSGLFVLIHIKKEIHSRDGFIMLFSLLIFYAFAWDGVISRWEGGFLVWLFMGYVLFFMTMKRKYKHEFHFPQYLREFVQGKGPQYLPDLDNTLYAGLDYYAYKEIMQGIFYEIRRMLTVTSDVVAGQASAIRYFLKQVIFLLIGVVGVMFGANLVVTSSSAFPIPHIVIGLVFVSIGTSLPELAVAISAVKKKYQNIMIGNIIGSNIANILLVGGLSALVRPLIIPNQTITIYFPVLLAFTWLFLVFSRNDRKITKGESITFLLAYIAFVAYIFLTLG